MTSAYAESGALFPQLAARLFAWTLGELPRFLEEYGYSDVGVSHVLNVFLHLDAQGERPAVLARKADITPQSMGALIDHLETRGYVMRVPDPTDGRSKLVVYADRGLEAAEHLTAWFLDMDAQWSRLIGSADQVDELRTGLSKLADLLETDPPRS